MVVLQKPAESLRADDFPRRRRFHKLGSFPGNEIGQSDPENEYIDINIDAQKFVARILDDVLAKAKVGNKGLTHKGLDKLKKARGD